MLLEEFIHDQVLPHFLSEQLQNLVRSKTNIRTVSSFLQEGFQLEFNVHVFSYFVLERLCCPPLDCDGY